ncbi:hypothetical protein FKW77_001831 [Venturia effusa]|uniref:Uncharacterized protein n=1 Tax=Venturia effusa TaxID=50376 RepID=A0A517LRE8_9PEZI|nr:hypothetical protein FKW77_001831 [Venturia effusa]
MISPDGTAHMIPYGLASRDELIFSDAASLSIAIHAGNKTAIEVAVYYFDRITGKNSSLRKSCSPARPSNTMRFAASPLTQNVGEDLGTIILSKEVFVKVKFLFLNRDGTCTMYKRNFSKYFVIMMGGAELKHGDGSKEDMIANIMPLCTKMEYTEATLGHEKAVVQPISIVRLVEELNSFKLTNEERLAVAIFLA